jgi:hypothetical protein
MFSPIAFSNLLAEVKTILILPSLGIPKMILTKSRTNSERKNDLL